MTDNAPKTRTTIQEILADTFRFTRRELAFFFAERSTKGLWVMPGDDGRYWVATPARCAQLERLGYEFAA
ncbi:MAG: hypothetical protein JWO87_2169 [Phycisphaerales bacterium]|jgi:hypothetical protein|nr:hypothetical protein [Phycisphaerales bacterium]